MLIRDCMRRRVWCGHFHQIKWVPPFSPDWQKRRADECPADYARHFRLFAADKCHGCRNSVFMVYLNLGHGDSCRVDVHLCVAIFLSQAFPGRRRKCEWSGVQNAALSASPDSRILFIWLRVDQPYFHSGSKNWLILRCADHYFLLCILSSKHQKRINHETIEKSRQRRNRKALREAGELFYVLHPHVFLEWNIEIYNGI